MLKRFYESNVFQSSQKPFVATDCTLKMCLNHFKSQFHNLLSKMSSLDTVSSEIIFKVTVIMVRGTKIKCIHDTKLWNFLCTLLHVLFLTLKWFFVLLNADILTTIHLTMTIVISVGYVLGLEIFKSNVPSYLF